MRTNSSGAEGHGFRIAEEPISVPRPGTADSPVLRSSCRKRTVWLAILLVGIPMAGILTVRGFGVLGNSTSSASGKNRAAAVLDIGVLVFREGLECILVLAAVTASLKGTESKYQRPVSVGAGIGFVATLLTWCVAVRIVDNIGENLSALAVQAATGLLAILVLLVVMNWFFHKLYWTGWISLYNQRKRELLGREKRADGALGVISGMALLGFTSFYREGFEVVAGYQFVVNEGRLQAFRGMGKLDAAEQLADEIIAQARAKQKHVKETQALITAATVAVAKNDEAKGIEELQAAIDLAKKGGFTRLLADAQFYLGAVILPQRSTPRGSLSDACSCSLPRR